MTFSFSVYGEKSRGSRVPLYIVRLYLNGTQVRPSWWRLSFRSAMAKGEKEARLANERYGRRRR